MKKTLLLILLNIFINPVFADSPLTSTDFYKAYMDVPMVQEASLSKGSITNEMMEYIDDDANPVDVKLAIINAIGWEHNGVMISKLFLDYVLKKKNYKKEYYGKYLSFEYSATSDELICYSYMLALDNYFDTVEAFEVASLALRKKPQSYAVNIIFNLIKSQGLTSYGEYCYASRLFLDMQFNLNIVMDMRGESLSYVFEYMGYIGKNCKTN